MLRELLARRPSQLTVRVLLWRAPVPVFTRAVRGAHRGDQLVRGTPSRLWTTGPCMPQKVVVIDDEVAFVVASTDRLGGDRYDTLSIQRAGAWAGHVTSRVRAAVADVSRTSPNVAGGDRGASGSPGDPGSGDVDLQIVRTSREALRLAPGGLGHRGIPARPETAALVYLENNSSGRGDRNILADK